MKSLLLAATVAAGLLCSAGQRRRAVPLPAEPGSYRLPAIRRTATPRRLITSGSVSDQRNYTPVVTGLYNVVTSSYSRTGRGDLRQRHLLPRPERVELKNYYGSTYYPNGVYSNGMYMGGRRVWRW